MAAETPLLIRRERGVVSFIINDAPWNCMSFAYMNALEAALDAAAADPAVRALLFTAEGSDNFSVGMDLKQVLREGPARGGWDGVRAHELAAQPPLAEAPAVERREFLRCAASEDQAEGLRAFADKRKPVFVGR